MGLVGRDDDDGSGLMPTRSSPLVNDEEETRSPWGEWDIVGNSWVT